MSHYKGLFARVIGLYKEEIGEKNHRKAMQSVLSEIRARGRPMTEQEASELLDIIDNKEPRPLVLTGINASSKPGAFYDRALFE